MTISVLHGCSNGGRHYRTFPQKTRRNGDEKIQNTTVSEGCGNGWVWIPDLIPVQNSNHHLFFSYGTFGVLAFLGPTTLTFDLLILKLYHKLTFAMDNL